MNPLFMIMKDQNMFQLEREELSIENDPHLKKKKIRETNLIGDFIFSLVIYKMKIILFYGENCYLQMILGEL